MRASVLLSRPPIRHRVPGRNASPFGSVVTGSLGLPSGLPAVQMDREGFPDMSWFSTTPRGVTGQVDPYPTRNFATLGIFVTPRCEHRGARTFLFRLALHVAMEIGPYLRSGLT